MGHGGLHLINYIFSPVLSIYWEFWNIDYTFVWMKLITFQSV